jgi:5-methylthioadenosine/S-adenosylhomocysteine deaminase
MAPRAPAPGLPTPRSSTVRGFSPYAGLVSAPTHSPMVLMRGAAEDVGVEAWCNERV